MDIIPCTFRWTSLVLAISPSSANRSRNFWAIPLPFLEFPPRRLPTSICIFRYERERESTGLLFPLTPMPFSRLILTYYGSVFNAVDHLDNNEFPIENFHYVYKFSSLPLLSLTSVLISSPNTTWALSLPSCVSSLYIGVAPVDFGGPLEFLSISLVKCLAQLHFSVG